MFIKVYGHVFSLSSIMNRLSIKDIDELILNSFEDPVERRIIEFCNDADLVGYIQHNLASERNFASNEITRCGSGDAFEGITFFCEFLRRRGMMKSANMMMQIFLDAENESNK